MIIGKFIGNEVEFLDGVIDEFYIFIFVFLYVEVEILMEKCKFFRDSKYNFVL